MGPESKIDVLEEAISNLSKEDLVKFLLQKLDTEEHGSIPVSIFTTTLSPLEAITRYLKEQGKKTNEIAKILGKKPSSVSEAIRNAKPKTFKIKKTNLFIPLSDFERYSRLSILEIVVISLKNRNLRLTEIADILGRDPRTIWTLHDRAKSKSAEKRPVKKKTVKKPSTKKPVKKKRLDISDYI